MPITKHNFSRFYYNRFAEDCDGLILHAVLCLVLKRNRDKNKRNMALIKQGKAIILHPMTRGMVAYSVLWPTGSIIQQTLAGQKWGKCQPAPDDCAV